MTAMSNVLINLDLDGVSLGPWLQRSDFEVGGGDSNKVRQPGGGYKSYPGYAAYGSTTFTRTFEVPRDSDKWPFIQKKVNIGMLTGTETVTDPETGAASGVVIRLTGRLTSAVLNETNVGEDGARQITLTCDVETIG